MPDKTISEDSFFFMQAETLCRGPAITCAPDLGVIGMARIMREKNISCIVVAQENVPVGIVSVRDCRDLLADFDGSLVDTRVQDIMSTDLVTIRRRDYLFDAVFKMSTHNIHRLIVVDDGGELFGVITATDLIRMKTRTPLYLNQEVAAARSVEELRETGARVLDTVRFATRAGADTRSVVRLISHFNDAITLRLIALLEETEGVRLPTGSAYLALGSEGRGEQTLRTDQDSAIVFDDRLSPEKQDALERFATRLVTVLEEIGVPRCPGNTMASNPAWRRSLTDWKRLLDQWITIPVPEHMVNFGMFQDLRVLHGDETLGMKLRDHIRAAVQSNPFFLPNMARHVVRFPPPLGMFGRIRTERSGEHRGQVDIKKAGIFAITVGATLLALETGSVGGTTWDKLELLGKRGILAPGDREAIEDAFTFLVQLRLGRQLRALADNDRPSNYVTPLAMTDKERDLFRQALRGAGTFLRIIRDHYQLDLVAR